MTSWFKGPPCPRCNSRVLAMEYSALSVIKHVVCNDCGFPGTIAFSRREAIRKWGTISLDSANGSRYKVLDLNACGNCLYGVPRKDLGDDMIECTVSAKLDTQRIGTVLLTRAGLRSNCTHFERMRK